MVAVHECLHHHEPGPLGGIEGGVLFPGHAFDNENGDTMTEVGMGRLRLGITF
jgi:hypothetical protein